MRIVKRVLSTYSADNFGVCSALYELGGLVVMHDASGCNSTYNTHDEPRWYDMDSMVFISGLTEKDAIFGNDEILIRNLCETAERLHPAFVCICGGPLPHIIGTDFRAVAKAVSRRTGMPAFGIQTNGMDSYINGAGEALACLVDMMNVPAEHNQADGSEKMPHLSKEQDERPGRNKEICDERRGSGKKPDRMPESGKVREAGRESGRSFDERQEGDRPCETRREGSKPCDAGQESGRTCNAEREEGKTPEAGCKSGRKSNELREGSSACSAQPERIITINILGATPLDFSLNGSIEAIIQLLSENGFCVRSTWAMGDTLDRILSSGDVDVNLVISAVGLRAARRMWETFHIPYVVGCPVGCHTSERIFRELREAAGDRSGNEDAEDEAAAIGSRNRDAADEAAAIGSRNREAVDEAAVIGSRDGDAADEVAGACPEHKTAAETGKQRCDGPVRRILLIGEPVMMKSMAEEIGAGTTIICPMHNLPREMAEGTHEIELEDDLREACRDADLVIADPLYKRLLPGENDKFIELPHVAYSGRFYEKEIPVLVGGRLNGWLAGHGIECVGADRHRADTGETE